MRARKTCLHSALLALVCLSLLSACGYTWRGQEGARSTHSVLGNGSSTVKFVEVDHPTVYTALPYSIRAQVRDEITARGLAIWQDSGTADYGLTVRVETFKISAYGQSRMENVQYTAHITVEFIVTDGRTNAQVWTSGVISYSEYYTNVDEESAIRETLQNAVRRGVDRMQRKF